MERQQKSWSFKKQKIRNFCRVCQCLRQLKSEAKFRGYDATQQLLQNARNQQRNSKINSSGNSKKKQLRNSIMMIVNQIINTNQKKVLNFFLSPSNKKFRQYMFQYFQQLWKHRRIVNSNIFVVFENVDSAIIAKNYLQNVTLNLKILRLNYSN